MDREDGNKGLVEADVEAADADAGILLANNNSLLILSSILVSSGLVVVWSRLVEVYSKSLQQTVVSSTDCTSNRID